MFGRRVYNKPWPSSLPENKNRWNSYSPKKVLGVGGGDEPNTS
jgi:hypothetical protein